jgi:FkbM family methyltransferase
VPVICERLKRNIVRNGLQNVEYISAALDAQNGTMLMTIFPKSALSTAHLRRNKEASGLEVQTITLARACAELNIHSIQLLKIDCEGSKYGIFKTMPHDLAGRIEQIAMEAHEVGLNWGRMPPVGCCHRAWGSPVKLRIRRTRLGQRVFCWRMQARLLTRKSSY